MLTKQDIEQLKQKGIAPEQIERQIENFRQGFPFVKLVAPATKEKGIRVFEETEINSLAAYYNEHSPQHELLKFVPASGAASRMFKHLFEFMQTYKGTESDIEKLESDKSFNSVYHFLQNIHKFAFYEDLKAALIKAGFDLEDLLEEKRYAIISEFLLTEAGLGYAQLPKGLLKFHRYDDFSRMAVGEHLVEGAHYACEKDRSVSIHFTVSPEHKAKFLDAIRAVQPAYEEKFNVKYNVTFSEQKPATDTIAVDMENNPFRDNDGKILFRPGGHGALIENLNDLKGEIIFVKNIDNIVPDRLKEPTYLYKRVIGGLLLKLQKQTFEFLNHLEKEEVSDDGLEKIARFARNDLSLQLDHAFGGMDYQMKRQYLFNMLNRPIRICGMVKNEGEPGGGPFWIENTKGQVSLQIVESSQIDMDNDEQKEIVSSATHFNPVDLVCGVRDYKGRQFDLKKYVDPSTGFISVKSKDGINIKAQELPGLWNGAMADWITVFVEVPIITFNPVKTVNDLLREQHLNP